MNRQSLLRAFALCAIGFLTVAANAAAAEGEVARSVIEDGRQQYMSLCASCHGESGKGDGPMAPELTAKLAESDPNRPSEQGQVSILACLRYH